jgi:glycosyltransferase involved in cell wall biosynthesis
MPRVLIDVTQWVHWPATTGVQRVIGHLAGCWRGDEVEASFGFLDNDAYVVGPINGFASVSQSQFERRDPGGDRTESGTSVARELRRLGEDIVPSERLGGTFSAYLLAEPTFRADSLSGFASLSAMSSPTPFALYYDALPLTHPQFFPGRVDRSGRVTRYHRIISQIENVAFISQSTRRVFETRIARRPLRNAVVVRPGADALSARPRRRPPEIPRFAMVGTVEPRKRYALVLDVFEQLWAMGRPYELIVLASAARDQEVVERLERLSRSEPLQWIRAADDEDVLDAMSACTALLFLSEAEGYGLPPMEALSVGCPVIASKDLPALEEIPANGQIRLETVNQELVYAAVEQLADPILNARYRSEIEELELPTWQRFAADVERWVASGLREERVGIA